MPPYSDTSCVRGNDVLTPLTNRWRFHLRLGGLFAALAILTLTVTGCAIHYYDKKSGTEHLWGFGHLKMRAVPQHGHQPPFTNAVMAFVTGNRVLGASISAGQDYGGVVAGWDSRSRVIIAAEDSQFYLLWPTNSIWLPQAIKDHLFTVRVGPDFPFTNGWYAATPNPQPSSP